MEKDKYKKTADDFSNIMRRFFLSVSQVLENEYGISMILAGHVAFLHPEHSQIRAATFAMGNKEIILGIPHVLEQELNNYFEEIEEDLKKEVISGFKVLRNNKKTLIH